ncbi:MAG: hypothetical protein ACRYGK_19310 [Janthinobacterium lividum]
MNNENTIQLSGPFQVVDASGQPCNIENIHIFDEGYGVIDVYIALAARSRNNEIHEDPAVQRQILARLRQLGYVGPDFGLGDPALQEDKLMVLEAGEEFATFASSKGWKDLAAEYADEDEQLDGAATENGTPASSAMLAALMDKLKTR